jgi:site-specific recombinase XerD
MDRLDLSLAQIDQYLQHRAKRMRRTSLKQVSMRLCSFLRFLYRDGYLPADFSGRVIKPTLYEYESIPSVLRPEEITLVLKTTRRDRSIRGRRDYAILCLLARYGLRAGEVVRLTLDDINCRVPPVRWKVVSL